MRGSPPKKRKEHASIITEVVACMRAFPDAGCEEGQRMLRNMVGADEHLEKIALDAGAEKEWLR